MMLQVLPDWSASWTKEQAEEELEIEFKGPGLYMTDSDTIIVLPASDRDGEGNLIEMPWKQEYSKGTRFDFHVYNCSFGETIFARPGSVPVRMDERTLFHGRE